MNLQYRVNRFVCQTVIMAVVLLSVTIFMSLSGCSTDPITGKKVINAQVKATVIESLSDLQKAANFCAPIATAVIAARAPAVLPAMQMANASLGALNTVIANAKAKYQGNPSSENEAALQASFGALQTAWSGIDAAYKDSSTAQADLEAATVAVKALVALVPQNPTPGAASTGTPTQPVVTP